ncbi:hypothetical protein SAMN05445060_1111 [Williamsia sterculiae]|uniref:Uncharacterized protein n=1 Tax=Williamsia sterculiae TaxID=1344003 RepID=A0A1N7E2A1_9NOCA|nr:hypothetical protein SAMN05445060_1111 [Williamsia sterculiae]
MSRSTTFGIRADERRAENRAGSNWTDTNKREATR